MIGDLTAQAGQPGTSTRTELVTATPAEALAGLLDIEPPPAAPGAELPPLWHWVYLLDRRPERDLGPDGHPTHGIPEPPGPGRLRMFAGGRVTVHAPVRFGEPATRTTRLVRSVEKRGRSGPLTFVTVRNDITQGGVLAVVDEQDIVYRVPEPTPSPRAEPRDSLDSEGTEDTSGTEGMRKALATLDTVAFALPASGHELELDVDPVLLFRFSALTYNAHRIHYDRDYANLEGYPDLVVHGPLQALLMAELLRRAGERFSGHQFAYRLLAPTFGTQRLRVGAGPDPRAGVVVHDGSGLLIARSTLLPVDPS
jgi:3-methylfumaryl-CoA hydratase